MRSKQHGQNPDHTLRQIAITVAYTMAFSALSYLKNTPKYATQSPKHPNALAGMTFMAPDLLFGVLVDAVMELCCVAPPDEDAAVE